MLNLAEVVNRLAAEPAVEKVVLADLDETRGREVGDLIGPKASPLVLDVNDSEALGRALAAADLAVMRSGASVMGELPALGLPAVFITCDSVAAVLAAGPKQINPEEVKPCRT